MIRRLGMSAFLLLSFLASVRSASAQWAAAPAFPTQPDPRLYAAAVVHNGTLYALGGTPWGNGNDMDGAVHYLPNGASSWVAGPLLGGMGPIIHQGAGVDALNRIIVFGGINLENGDPGENKVYDPTEGPTSGIASRPGAAPDEHFAFCTDDQHRVYSLGGGPGASANGSNPNSAYCARYNATNNTWQAIAAMPNAVACAAAVYDGQGHVLVLGGYDQTALARTANVAQFDIALGTWSDTAIPDMPVALSELCAVLGADGRVYAMGGRTGPIASPTIVNTVYVLDLPSNTWSAGPSMITARHSFAAALAADDHIYAMGGETALGGTWLVEKLFTPTCPSFAAQPNSIDAWNGTVAGFSVTVAGGAPITCQWRRNGNNLSDGPTGTGSTITGATTTVLTINSPGVTDEGTYDCVATNACGSTTSDPATLTIRMPPALPTTWTVTPLHPAWAQTSSVAHAVCNGRIGGEAATPTLLPDGRTFVLAHPVLWSEPSWSPVDLTPGGSVGGGILDMKGDIMAGWFWHTYQCWAGGQWWTCAWRSAGYWSGDPPVFDEVHVSGAEYDSVNGTDGVRMVGTVTFEYTEGNYFSNAYLWSPPNYFGLSLHPAPNSGSSAAAVEGDNQYGSVTTPYPGPTVRAAMWSGSAASFVDLHPSGFARSWVSGAGDGQAVGSAVLGNDVGHAVLWAGAPGAVIDLHPSGSNGSSAHDAEGGIQVGASNGSAALWTGTAASFVDLGVFVPANFGGSSALGIEVATDGTITIVGYGYNSTTARQEALMWRSTAAPIVPGDLNCDGLIDGDDIHPFVLALVNPAAYAIAFPACNVLNGDLNGDQQVTVQDAAPFTALLLSAP